MKEVMEISGSCPHNEEDMEQVNEREWVCACGMREYRPPANVMAFFGNRKL